jgi:hypothetical protein
MANNDIKYRILCKNKEDKNNSKRAQDVVTPTRHRKKSTDSLCNWQPVDNSYTQLSYDMYE